jgi:glycosyltransferase involved in cell wall biosynthesis
VQRTTKFLKYLGRLGWTAAVITAEPEYWILDTSLAGDIPPGTRVERTRSLTAYTLLQYVFGTRRAQPAPLKEDAQPAATAAGRRPSGAFRTLKTLSDLVLVPDQYIGWVPFALARARRVLREERPDILYTTSSPDSAHLIGRRLARETGLPWVADFRDPWTDRTSYAPPTPLHDRWQRSLEHAVLREATRVLTTTSSTRDDFLAKYPDLDAAKFHAITNGFDEEDFALARADAATRRAARPSDAPLTLLHTGKLADHRTAGALFEALADLRRSDPPTAECIRVTQLGPRDSANEAFVPRLGLTGLVEFADSVPYAEAIRRQATADVLLLVESVGKRSEIVIPGKLFEYLGAGRPVLALCAEGSEIARVVRETGAGWVEPPTDVARLRARLVALVAARRDGTLDRDVSAERVARYTRRATAEELDAVLCDILARRRGAGEPLTARRVRTG